MEKLSVVQDRNVYYKFLSDENTFTSILIAFIRAKYGDEAIFWSPTTLYLELRDDYAIDIDPDIMDKLSAGQVIMSNNSFFTRVDAFYGIANTLTTGAPSFTIMDPVTPEECIWAIIEVAMMRDFLPLDYRVQRFIEVIYNGMELPSIIHYVLTEPNPTSEGIIKLVDGILENPQTDMDMFIVEQLGDLFNQLAAFPKLAKAVIPESWRD